MDTVGLIVGHTPDEPGATNREQQISEWHFNRTLAAMVDAQLQDSKIILRDRPNDWGGLPGKVNQAGVDFAVSMHLNAYKGDAKGSESLHWYNSNASQRLGQALLDNFVNLLGTQDRGRKEVRNGDRGWRLLKQTTMPIAIAEPFFIDDQLSTMQPHTAKLAAAYLNAIDEYRGGV